MFKASNFLFLSLVLISGQAFAGSPQSRYVGPDSVLADVEFDSYVDFIQNDAPTLSEAEKKVSASLLYMIGPMRMAADGYPAAVWGENKPTNIQISLVGPDHYRATFHYAGKISIDSRAPDIYSFYLVTDPDHIVEQSKVNGRNSCVRGDESEGYWYTFMPSETGCPLKEGVDYLKIPVQPRKLANTQSTYPEYDRLFDQNKNLTVWTFHGKSEPGRGDDVPETNRDEGAYTYLNWQSWLEENGFQMRSWTKDEIENALGYKTANPPTIREFQAQFGDRTLIVRAFFGETQFSQASKDFHYLFKNALESASVVMYDGHSGQGSNYSLPLIEDREKFRIQIPQDRYQIFNFNSCLPWVYYTASYFDRKKSPQDPLGNRQLDIISLGVEGQFSNLSLVPLAQALRDFAQGGPIMSYQELAQLLPTNLLFNISGDEDNPHNPPLR